MSAIKILISHGADKSLVDGRGLSVFDLAAQQGNEEGIEILENYA